MDFAAYPKTPRLNRKVIVTEKIDGTNAQIVISEFDPRQGQGEDIVAFSDCGHYAMRVGSRSRWIRPGKDTDNYGFAGWCLENARELFSLGPGQHFGEWYGKGIQRNYGLDHRRFALFNTARWGDRTVRPACCHVVPSLAECAIGEVQQVVEALRNEGSVAVPGFPHPEGVIVYHTAASQVFKVLLDNDDIPKGLVTSQPFQIGK